MSALGCVRLKSCPMFLSVFFKNLPRHKHHSTCQTSLSGNLDDCSKTDYSPSYICQDMSETKHQVFVWHTCTKAYMRTKVYNLKITNRLFVSGPKMSVNVRDLKVTNSLATLSIHMWYHTFHVLPKVLVIFITNMIFNII